MKDEPIDTTAVVVAQDNPVELMRRATDAAGVSREIVLKTAITIQKRKYVRVEGWQAIAVAHGCIASSRDVDRVETGFKAVGEIRRMSDGVLLATAEGFVGDDELSTWGKRPEYARRAMAQTRAISRVCRAAFAHVVIMMDAGLSTTPAEEMPDNGFDDTPKTAPPRQATPSQAAQRLGYLRPAQQTQVSAARPADDEGGFDAAAPKTPPAASMDPSQQETPEERKERFISVFKPYGDASTQVFRIRGLVLDTESFQDIDTVKIGLLSRANVTALLEEVKQVHGGKEPPVVSEGDERLPDDLHDPADYQLPHPDSEPWRKLIVPFGKNAHKTLGELPRGALKYYVCDWVPKPHEFKGKMYQPKESDMVFYKTLQRYAKEIIQRYGYDREDRRD